MKRDEGRVTSDEKARTMKRDEGQVASDEKARGEATPLPQPLSPIGAERVALENPKPEIRNPKEARNVSACSVYSAVTLRLCVSASLR